MAHCSHIFRKVLRVIFQITVQFPSLQYLAKYTQPSVFQYHALIALVNMVLLNDALDARINLKVSTNGMNSVRTFTSKTDIHVNYGTTLTLCKCSTK